MAWKLSGLGGEDKRKVLIAGGLGVVVLVLLVKTLVSTFGGDSTPPPVAIRTPSPVSAPAVRPDRRTPATRTFTGVVHEAVKIPGSLAALDPTLHPEIMAQAESLVYTGKGRNIFSMSAAPVQIEQLHAAIRPHGGPIGPVVPQGPPPPPAIALKFFGFASQSGNKKAFLLHGDDVFIAATGDVVDHRYKVVRIDAASIQVEDLPYSNTQTLPLVQN